MRLRTRREKILVYLFVFVLIVVGGFTAVIAPIIAHNAELKIEHDALKIERDSMEIIDRTREQNISDLVTSKKEVTIILDQISDPVDNASFDKRIHSLTSKHGVSVQSVQYDGPVITIPQVEYMSPSGLSYEMKEDVDQINEYKVYKSGIEVSAYEVITETIQVSISGSFENISNMLDDSRILGRTVFVTSFNYNFSDNTANMTIEVFSVDKIK